MDYEEQLSAAKFRAERDQARQELERERHLRKLAESAAAERDTVRAEDHEAAAWVRDNGGLESVKKLLDWVVGHCSTKQQLDFDFWLSGRVMYELGFEEDMADRDEVERRLLARLVPEGIEWPRYEDGEPVRIGDEAPFGSDGRMVVTGIELVEGGFVLHGRDGGIERPCQTGYKVGVRVKRPAPKVLDADGVEICVGDRLYDTDTGCERTVRAVNDNGTVEFDGHENRGWFGWFLTHRAPVLAADGEPLEVGQTVWDENGDELRVLDVYGSTVDEDFPDHTVRCRRAGAEDYESTMCAPSRLTHQRPETWQRIEEDVASASCPDVYCANHHIDASDTSYEWAMARDIVRRARALAEKENRNE